MFTHNDALSCLDPIDTNYSGDSVSCQYSGVALDAQYRAALEIARRGELEIIVPDTVGPLLGEQCLPIALPSRCRADVVARFAKLVHSFMLLTTANRAHVSAPSPSLAPPQQLGMKDHII